MSNWVSCLGLADAVRLYGSQAIWRDASVGGSAERGVVAAASYEARKFGVRSAIASVTAKRQCPDLVFIKPRFEVYKAISRQIREIFAEQTT